MLEITLSLRAFEINDIFNFRQNSRWQPKSRSQDKCVFALYAEIQDGRRKWRLSIFVKHRQFTLQIPCGLKISSKSLYLKHLELEIQDGSQNWRESHFSEK